MVEGSGRTVPRSLLGSGLGGRGDGAIFFFLTLPTLTWPLKDPSPWPLAAEALEGTNLALVRQKTGLPPANLHFLGSLLVWHPDPEPALGW